MKRQKLVFDRSELLHKWAHNAAPAGARCKTNGCSPSAIGRAVFGEWLSDGSRDRIERYDVLRLATTDEIKAGQVYAALPAAVRLETQIKIAREQVDKRLEQARVKKPTRDELLGLIYLLRRHIGDLRHQLDYPLDEVENTKNTALRQYINADAERWDKRNRNQY